VKEEFEVVGLENPPPSIPCLSDSQVFLNEVVFLIAPSLQHHHIAAKRPQVTLLFCRMER